MNVQVQLYYPKEQMCAIVEVKQVGENRYKMLDNDMINLELTLGTEFTTKINEVGWHEVYFVFKD